MARDVRVTITGDARDFRRATREAEDDANRLDTAFRRVGRGFRDHARDIAIGAGVVVAGAGYMAMGFIRAAEESQQVANQTAAVLESMGATAWTNAERVEALATSISNLTGLDDEMIQAGQNTLLTYGSITENFDRATQSMVDVAVARGMDMSSAADLVGKALNDPIRGLQQLRRVGIQFTAQQEEQIRTMVEAGDVAGAQGIMLDELGRQFGGSAEAQATASQRLSTMWGNLQEQLGEYLLPIVEDVTTWLGENLPTAIDRAKDFVSDLVDRGRDLTAWAEAHKPVIIGLAAAIGTGLVIAFGAWAVSAAAAAVATLAATWPVLAIAAGVGLLVGAVIYAYQNWDTFRETVDRVGRFLRDTVWPIIQEGARLIGEVLVTAFNTAKSVWDTVGPAVSAVAEVILGSIQGVIDIVDTMVGGIVGAIDRMRELLGLGSEVHNKQMPTAPTGTRGSDGTVRPVPVHHSGGVYMAPGGAREGLALLESGETIIPRGQSVPAGGSLPVQVQVLLDSKIIHDALVSYNRTNGPLQVQVA